MSYRNRAVSCKDEVDTGGEHGSFFDSSPASALYSHGDSASRPGQSTVGCLHPGRLHGEERKREDGSSCWGRTGDASRNVPRADASRYCASVRRSGRRSPEARAGTFYACTVKFTNREDLSFHSCRHTTGSWRSRQGVPLGAMSEILGHSSTRGTEMSSHLQPEVMERAMDETFVRDVTRPHLAPMASP